MSHPEYRSCIDACVRCAEACEECAAACLEEPDMIHMADCARRGRDGAELCWLAAAFLSRGSPFAQVVCAACADVCAACGLACEKYETGPCLRCAEACRRCAEECRRLSAPAVA
jgi:hypothetical protein